MAGSSPGARPGYTAYLRVYEPLAALPPRERSRWERYLGRSGDQDSETGWLDPAAAARAEHGSGLAAAVLPRIDVAEEHALLRRHDGLTFVCPLDMQRRVWEALLEFRTGMAEIISNAFVPRALADEAEQQLAAWVSQPDARPPHVISATWQVPIHWFLLVEPDERVLSLGRGRGDAGRSLRYHTTMAAARRRAARARTLLQRTLPDVPAVRGLDLVSRWLEEFHPHSRIELDYGDLVHLVSDEFLSTDTSVADLEEGMGHLRAGDAAAAAAAHERYLRRWTPVSALENAS